MYSVLMAENAEGFKLSSDMFNGLTSAVTDNATIIVPIGLTIMGVLLGIKLVPKIIRYFI